MHVRSSLLVSLIVFAAACGPAAPSHGDDTGVDAGPNDTCSGSDTRCLGDEYQQCTGGHFVTQQMCSGMACSPTLGCVACDPVAGNSCNGNSVVACNADGTFGSIVMTCNTGETCTAGACSRECSADGVDLIYVVDEQNELLSFDPRLLAQGANVAFHKIGTLACPAGPSWSDWAANAMTDVATPFSMGVDRNAVAWVLYSSGEIFNVKTSDASCIGNSGYQQGPDGNPQNGMEVFGMGFVTDTAGGNTEHLYLGGGDIMATPGGSLAVLDPTSPAHATLVPAGLPNQGQDSPELTGTGAGQMFGFYPGTSTAFVQEISKAGAATGMKWNIPGGLGTTKKIRAWAFAQWGGVFYIFVTTDDDGMGTNLNSTVHSIDKASNTHKVELQNLPYTIVGAGVSTCAPTVVN